MLDCCYDELICDLAQTYHIYDHKSLPARQVAAFACGLDRDSRVKRRLSGSKAALSDTLLAMIFDRLQILCWSMTKDGRKGINRPQMMAQKLLGAEAEKTENAAFESGGEFMKEREKILKGGR